MGLCLGYWKEEHCEDFIEPFRSAIMWGRTSVKKDSDAPSIVHMLHSLYCLACILFQIRRPHEALSLVQEASDLYRELAKAEPQSS